MTVEAPVATESATRRRGIAGWIGIAIVLLLVGGVGAALSGVGRWAERDALDDAIVFLAVGVFFGGLISA